MSKYPLSIQDQLRDGRVSQAFAELLRLHVPAPAAILDPTSGTRLLWGDILGSSGQLQLSPKAYSVTFSDLAVLQNGNEQQDVFSLLERQDWRSQFDAVVYDPPYLIGTEKSTDKREVAYGKYDHQHADLWRYMQPVTVGLPEMLRPYGKLIIKCSDQYLVPERRFYDFHYHWLTCLRQRFNVLDIMIYRHHHVSPTAFQVKNRPACVIVHTYFLVGQRKD